MPKKIFYPLSGMLVLGLILRLYFVLSNHYISPDGTQYAMLGYNLGHFFEYQSNGSHFPDIIQPPFYPFLIAIFSFLFSPEMSGKLVSLVFGLLLVFAVYRFSMFLKPDRGIALAAAGLMAIHPALTAVSSQVASEAVFLFFLFSAFALGWYYLQTKNTPVVWLISFTWLLAFLTRPEGLIYFGIYFLILVYHAVKKMIPLKAVFIYLLPFLTGFTIYGAVTFQVTNQLSLSPKISFVKSHGKLFRYLKNQDALAGNNSGNKIISQKTKYSLTPDSKQLAADAVFNKDSLMLKAMAAPQIQKRNSKNLFAALAKLLISNARTSLTKVKSGLVFPFIYFIALLAGFFVIRKRHRPVIFYGMIMSLPVFSFLVSHVEERFLYGLIPISAVFLGAGSVKFLQFLKSYSKKPLLSSYSWIVVFITLCLVLNLPYYLKLDEKVKAKDHYHEAGLVLKHELPANAKIAAVVPQAVFYSGSKYSVLPFASIDKVLIYLREKQVDYLLWEKTDNKKRPMLSGLFGTDSKFHLKLSIKSGHHQFYLYRLNEE